MIATEPLPKALMDNLFPNDRVVSDTCKVIYYYRPSPDRSRVLFGGRVSADETNPTISGPILKKDMCRIFPELTKYNYTHSWTGTVAFTFDTLPHQPAVTMAFFTRWDIVDLALDYPATLVPALANSLLEIEGATAFDSLRFPTRPLYYGKPWFLSSIVRWYRWRDKTQIKQALARARLSQMDRTIKTVSSV